jgi:hypothetical protein
MIAARTMLAVWAPLVAVSVLLAHPAQAQMQYPARPPYPDYSSPPIAPADMAFYCVYDNRVYSIGSGLCFGRTAYVCVPTPGPSTGNRAYWSSKEDQIFGRPTCG